MGLPRYSPSGSFSILRTFIAWSTVLVEALLAALAWRDLARCLPLPTAVPENGGQSTSAHMVFLLRAGAPLSLAAGLEVGVFQLSGLVVAQAGVDALAAHQALLTVAAYAAAIPVALTTSCSILVAEQIARGRSPRGVVRGAAIVGVSLAVGLVLATLLLGGRLVALFVARGSLPWALAVEVGPWLAVLLVADTLQGTAGGVLRGFQDTRFIGRTAALCLGVGGAGGLLATFCLGAGVRAVWSVLGGALLLMLAASGHRLLGLLSRSDVA